MKPFKLFSRIPVFCALVLLLVPSVVCMRIRSDSIPLNFDRLFPETPMQIVLENCMQVQNELNVRTTHNCMDEYETSWFIDAVVGRLFHVLSCVQNIIDKKVTVHPEDVHYILSLVERLAATYDKKFQSIVPARGNHVIALLASIKKALESLMVSSYSNATVPVSIPAIKIPVAPI